MRIVSLIASATEMVHALGLGEFQVGRSHECDFPEQVRSLPVCTAPRFDISGDSRQIDRRVKETLADAVSVYRVFEDVLERLQPTHIVTQTQCKVCAVSLDDVERALSARLTTRPQVVALEPASLAGVYDDVLRLARACGVEDRGMRLIESMRARMHAIGARARAASARNVRRPRVAAIEWQEPLMAAGNWVPELIESLGAENLFGRAGEHSPWMDWETLAASGADAIVCMPCGYNLDQTRTEMHWLTQRPEWGKLRAVDRNQVYLADGNQYFNRPGPRLAESLQILAEILYPEVFDPALEGLGWERYINRAQDTSASSVRQSSL